MGGLELCVEDPDEEFGSHWDKSDRCGGDGEEGCWGWCGSIHEGDESLEEVKDDGLMALKERPNKPEIPHKREAMKRLEWQKQ
jgi:hypothetical protein